MSSFDAMWGALEPVGRHPGTGGYRRFAWTRTDSVLREWFTGEASARSLDVTSDRAGNLWAWTADPDTYGPGIVLGSHLDSVPDGGAFDGPLGVVSAFAALDALDVDPAEPAGRARRPIGIACFADEEGARFGVACAGSRLLTGALDPDRARNLRDADGVCMADAMAAAGHDPAHLGRDAQTLDRIGTFVELHVEQGRNLATQDAAVGVAESIWPHGRWRLDLHGRADHAGTTRLADRDDPMLVLATAIQAARTAAERHDSLATIGKLRVSPNGVNAIPSAVTAWLDARGPVEEDVRAVVADVATAAGVDPSEESWTPATSLDLALRHRLATLLAAPTLTTGAGHDAGVLAAAGIATAMLFVRNPTGVSHSPAEHAEPADCHAGVDALATVIRQLG